MDTSVVMDQRHHLAVFEDDHDGVSVFVGRCLEHDIIAIDNRSNLVEIGRGKNPYTEQHQIELAIGTGRGAPQLCHRVRRDSVHASASACADSRLSHAVR